MSLGADLGGSRAAYPPTGEWQLSTHCGQITFSKPVIRNSKSSLNNLSVEAGKTQLVRFNSARLTRLAMKAASRPRWFASRSLLALSNGVTALWSQGASKLEVEPVGRFLLDSTLRRTRSLLVSLKLWSLRWNRY
jgi:hypothetical protein